MISTKYENFNLHDRTHEYSRKKVESSSRHVHAHSTKSDHNSQSHKSKMSRSAHKPIMLKPFGHQVSGRASILCYNQSTLVKSFVQREVYFYRTMPHDLKPLTSEFRGIVRVTFVHDISSGVFVAYGLPDTELRPGSRQVAKLSERPKPHSKRCVKDYGKSHVIYPPSQPLSNYDETNDDDDVMSQLSAGFETSVSIDERGEVKSGLHNPWNSRMLQETWSKIKEKPLNLTRGKTQDFVMLENVASKFMRPCVLDLKLGTKVRENASPEKLARHTTAINIGARVSGMQIFHPDKKEFVYHNKYYGHQLSVEGFHSSLIHFFSRGRIPFSGQSQVDYSSLDVAVIKKTISKLRKLRNVVAQITSHRFYSSSVLLLYEGDMQATKETVPEKDAKKADIWKGVTLGEYIHRLKQQSNTKSKSWHAEIEPTHKSTNVPIPSRKRHQSEPIERSRKVFVDVRMIDFAHFCFHDDKIHPGPDPGFLFGLNNLIDLLNKLVDQYYGRADIVASV